jgi:tetratricopeptide (TPR) repeat protein
LLEELADLEQQLDREKSRYSSASAAMKSRIKPSLDNLTEKVAIAKANVENADKELMRGFDEYTKVTEMKPQDKGVLSEMATNYYNFRHYNQAAQTWAKLINPASARPEDYMQIGKAYYNGEKFKTADSVFNVVVKKWPDHIPAYLWIARTYSKMDPDTKLGLAKPKFEKLLNVTKSDSLANEAEILEACRYLGYYHMMNNNYNQSKEYYNRLINLNPNNKEDVISGYNGLGQLEYMMATNEKTNEGRLPWLARSADAYNKILAIDPNNALAKGQVNNIHEFEAQVRKGINPNEIKGVIKDAATGQGIPYASIRVKDTAAENLTNTKGEYKFEIPQGSEVLIISANGYITKEIPITKSRVYNVSLEK